MSIKQYIIHLFQWLYVFPRFSNNEHTWIGVAGSGHFECMICDAEMDDEE